ncbi:hypothetical protein EV424DRAFT_1333064 [Suillus variegatus]|nr:hypothetical protein EV424DRAFT_1333064 [Suillus variegatus]
MVPHSLALPSPIAPSIPAHSSHHLQLNPSSLCPPCRAEEHIFRWHSTNTPPPSTIEHPLIQHVASLANRASLRDTASYGAGLRKFHLFCNIFSIPESARLPASFELLHSFVLWAPVSSGVACKYLSAVRAWHIAQGWPPPLNDSNHERINWSLRGLENLHGRKCKLLRPPITLTMLTALKATLALSDPFDACIWAMASCAFFGMMRFGEVSCKS